MNFRLGSGPLIRDMLRSCKERIDYETNKFYVLLAPYLCRQESCEIGRCFVLVIPASIQCQAPNRDRFIV